MPNAYTVVWCSTAGNRHVLLATKRFLGHRFGGAPSPATLLNGAGQACFPGGGINAGETGRQAARREFLEETGVDILSPPSIALYNVTDNNVANIGGAAHQYSTLYVKVATLLDLQNLSNAINVNILANTPADDELQTTQVVAEAAVAGMLGAVPGAAAWYGPPRMAALAGAFRVRHAGAWHQIPAGFVLPIRRPFVTAKLNSPHGWFQDMMDRLAGIAAAVAMAHAPLPVGPVMGLAPVMPPLVGGGPPPVAPPGGLGAALKTAYVLAAVAAVGVAVALNYVIPYMYPSDKPS